MARMSVSVHSFVVQPMTMKSTDAICVPSIPFPSSPTMISFPHPPPKPKYIDTKQDHKRPNASHLCYMVSREQPRPHQPDQKGMGISCEQRGEGDALRIIKNSGRQLSVHIFQPCSFANCSHACRVSVDWISRGGVYQCCTHTLAGLPTFCPITFHLLFS